VDDFRDPDDPALFPRLTEAQIRQLAVIADHRLLATGEALFEQGQRETPFFVVRAGAVDIFDEQPELDSVGDLGIWLTAVTLGASLAGM
jgi:CRP-like cAMP-binding protein